MAVAMAGAVAVSMAGAVAVAMAGCVPMAIPMISVSAISCGPILEEPSDP